MNRISRDELYMQMCDLIAQRGTCGRAQVGCVITMDGKVISTGYNGPPKGKPHCNDKDCDLEQSCKRAVHAEINAIENATNCDSLVGATLYCLYSPCYKCAKEIVGVGITNVYFKHIYKTDDKAGLLWLTSFNVKVYQYGQ